MQRKKGQLYYRAKGFTERFVALMAQDAVSQSAIATRLGVSQAAVSNWARGAVPQLRTARALAEIFGVNANWLLFDEGPRLPDGQPERIIKDLPIPQNYTPPLSEKSTLPAVASLDAAALRELASKLNEASAALSGCAKIVAKAAGAGRRKTRGRSNPPL